MATKQIMVVVERFVSDHDDSVTEAYYSENNEESGAQTNASACVDLVESDINANLDVKEPHAQHCEATSDIDHNMLPEEPDITSNVYNCGTEPGNAN